MQSYKVIKGRVVYVSRERVLVARGNRILESLDGGYSWNKIILISTSFFEKIMMASRVFIRLFRKGVHHYTMSKSCSLILANRSVYSLKYRQLRMIGSIYGSRPLSLCEAKDVYYYGEYRSNPDRSPVHVWKLEVGQDKWYPAWRFENIRHIHGVFHDTYTDTIWVTTGDKDNEAGIWRTNDNFKTLEKVRGGSQQFRAVQLLFTENHVYFGSDAPNEQNSIFRMKRDGGNVESLASVGGSVFYGCKVGDNMFFSTAVEPSQVNTRRYAEVWGTSDGHSWSLIRHFKKDIWPLKYFQYGQVLFPAGPGDGENLWMTPFATKGDQNTIRLKV